MKILVPDYPTPDSFSDNVAHTLKKMGHDVLTPGRKLPLGGRLGAEYERLRAKASPNHATAREQWAISAAKSFKPEMVLALTLCFCEETLRRLRLLGVRHRVAWWGDSPANQTEMGLLTQEWDLICMKDPDGAAKLRRVGLNAKLLHEAMNPDWHRPLAVHKNDLIVVAGNYYGYRQYLLRELSQRGIELALYGARAPRWALPEINALHIGRYVAREDKSRVFGEGLACLNSTQFAEGNSLNCRAFEVAGAGGLQLIEFRPIIGDCFEPGRELLVFASMDELLEHIERARRSPDESRRVREAGARRAHAQHTYQQRLELIFSWVGAV